MKILELKYSNTNTYLIKGKKGNLLFDTGWAGTYDAFRRCMGEAGERVQDINMILISHFHPDHMGIAQEIADEGAVIAVCDIQKSFIHSSDHIFEKENRKNYRPIDDEKIRIIEIQGSRKVLGELGIDGEIIHTPGHSDDSISLLLDTGELFVGDLNPLYELELHRGTAVEDSWNRLLSRGPKVIYYGHALTHIMNKEAEVPEKSSGGNARQEAVERIVKLIDKGCDAEKICRKTGCDGDFVQDVMRMYLTHPGVSVQGILDRIEIKGR